MIKRLVISAPFGNYLSHEGATRTLGTFTRQRRGGLLWRFWRVLWTVRYSRRSQSWLNRLGLPNPGIRSLDGGLARSSIVSVHGFSREDWMYLVSACRSAEAMDVEMNLSCPNVGHRHVVADGLPAVESALRHSMRVIAKLPPVRWFDYAVPLYDAGVRYFHLCNTIPTPGGGMSGKPLKQFSLWAVEEFRQRWGNRVTLIGGGGVTSVEDVRDYLKAGADHVAVGSMLLNPFNWRRLNELALVAEGKL